MPLYEVISVLPEVFAPYMDASIMGRAQTSGLFSFHAYNLRDWTHDRHRTVDDAPFGGGPGMLMKPEPLFEAIEDVASQGEVKPHIVMFSPCGQSFTQADAERLSMMDRLLLVCGRYEGIDERVYSLADEVISIGDYILTGAELAALTVLDATIRLLEGALGDSTSAQEESFSCGLLEYEQYTRPASFRGMDVPEVLLSGDHQAIDRWRRQNSLERTARLRPDLLTSTQLTDKDREYLRQIGCDTAHLATVVGRKNSEGSVRVS